MSYNVFLAALPAVLLLCHASGCARSARAPAATSAPMVSAGTAGPRLMDVAARVGITYRWSAPGKRPLDILQTIGNGCAFLDYDADQNLDILLIGPRLTLYRGDGKGAFRDVTAAAGLDRLQGNFRGCAVADYDNDGFSDVYISAYRGGALLRNEAGKRFRDVTRQAGIATQPWGASCAFGDIDNDGFLDLYICNYVKFGPASVRLCKVNNVMTSCAPHNYDAEKGVLYRNRGGGTFGNVTEARGAGKVSGKALGVAFADFDGSGYSSLAIANDEVPGDLLHNTGKKPLQNIGPESGTAYAQTGKPHAGMGIDWGDYGNDGKLDLVVTTFSGEAKPVFRSEGDRYFSDQSLMLGLANATNPYVAFGVKWLDIDNDGWLDLIIANGHTSDNIADYDRTLTYRQPTQLFRNDGGRRFADVSSQVGPDLIRPIVGRGLAVGDYDNDGRMDALVVDSEGPPLLLHNESPDVGGWLSLLLKGTRSNRDGMGAVLTIRDGARTLVRHCHTDGSYLSASDRRVHVGLGKSQSATVEVRWPSGQVDIHPDVPANQRVTLTEGVRDHSGGAAIQAAAAAR